MRRYFACFFLPLAIAALGLGALLAINAGVTTQTNYWEVEGYKRKLALTDVPQRKLLVVAGSNAYFGINAQMLERATGLRAVNLGMQAGLSFDLIAALLRGRIKPGDVVLMPLEYTYYGEVHSRIRQRTNTLVASVAWSLLPSFVLTQPISEWLTFFRHLTFARLWEGVTSRITPPRDGYSYRVSGIDRWGDNTTDYRDANTADILRANLVDERARGLPHVDRGSRRLQDIERFVDWAKANKVTVLAAFPNTLATPPFEGPVLEGLHREIMDFWAARQVPFVDDRQAAIIGPDDIAETPYHPSMEGARRRTGALLRLLCAKVPLCIAPGG